MTGGRQQLRSSRGFTLIELLAVVVIMGILATIGLSSFLGQMRQARTAEVRASIKAICAAQERFRAENLQYFNVSTDINAYYPTVDPGLNKYTFFNQPSSNNASNWERLRPQISEPVRYAYASVAGLPTTAYPDLGLSATVGWPATVSPWYAVKAIGDYDDDGVNSVVVATSFSNTLLWENESE